MTTIRAAIAAGSLFAAVTMAQSPTYTVNDGLIAGGAQTGNTLQAVLW